MSVPTACQTIQDQIDSLQQEIAALQEELNSAPASEKPGILAQIRAIGRQLGVLDGQLSECIRNPPEVPPPPKPLPPPLDLVFTGTATVTTTFVGGEGPYVKPLRMTAVLNGERTVIALTSYLSITTDVFETPLGLNQTTVTKTSGGIGAYASGHISLPVTLRFDQSIDVPFYEEDSTLSLTLRTDAPGVPVSQPPYGRVKLVGNGQFDGGVLGGSTGTVVLDGVLAAPMPTTVPDVRELRKAVAVSLVHAAGLESRVVGAASSPNAWVFTQSPAAETVVFRGSTVTLNLRSGPIP
jgi:hypothetical protein